jgi:hypothetical protein
MRYQKRGVNSPGPGVQGKGVCALAGGGSLRENGASL